MAHAYAVSSYASAAPGAVFSALVRAATWQLWSPIDAVEIEGGGSPEDRQQVGDTRIFRTGRHVSRERIVELVPDRRFGYENVSGTFRSYRGTVELVPASRGGTEIAWSGVFEPKWRFSGRFWQWYLTRYMRRMADGLAAYASEKELSGEG
ncbi:SRPBCC family protein [Streptomyces sp. NPDC002536]